MAAEPTAVNPPWEPPQFFSEDGLRAAQEYYFQTHATNSRLIAEGRAAQGVAKSLARRRMAKEFGEDFKLYTGTNLGQASRAEEMASLGIRGELNALLEHIYRRIAPGQAITSPAQEDLTILQHPHGALEVCYAMVFYYSGLLRRYASLAANRRKVLKSIMDEELFKWVWRMVIGFMMAPEEVKTHGEDAHLSAGLPYIPTDQQRVGMGRRLQEIGLFLLSKSLAESHLRVPLCYYFVAYLRQLQTLLALRCTRQELDEVYKTISKYMEGEPVEAPLVAVDVLLNGKGNSMDAFEDVLKDEQAVAQFIPQAELAFINQFEDFGNPQRMAATIKRLLPDFRREAVEGVDSNLMPLMLTLRTMPGGLRNAVVTRMPLPLLNMLRNRIANTTADDVGRTLAEDIRAIMDARKGESYTLQTQTADAGKAAVATSVRAAAAKDAPPRDAATSQATQPTAERPAATPAAAPPNGGGGPAAPAAAAAAANGGAAAPAPAAPEAGDLFQTPVLLAWRLEGERMAAISIAARELLALVGNEPRFLVAWVVFAMRTGQVFGPAPERIAKEEVEQLVHMLRAQAPAGGGRLTPEQQAAVLSKVQGGSQCKALLALLKAVGVKDYMHTPPELESGLAGLHGQLGEQLGEFLRQPNDERFKALRGMLGEGERRTVSVLTRVARAQ